MQISSSDFLTIINKSKISKMEAISLQINILSMI